MKEKFKSRKFWIALLSNIVSISVIFTETGGRIGTIAGMIGVIAASISYMIAETMVDVTRTKTINQDLLKLVQDFKGNGGD